MEFKELLKISNFEKIIGSTLCTDKNQISRSVLLDHKMIIEGVQYHEKKELECNEEDGVDMCTLSHSRSIGDQTYTANHKFVDGEAKDEKFRRVTLAEDEVQVADFKKDWKDNWHPTLNITMFAGHVTY